MSLSEIHGRLGNTAVYYVIIMGVWGLWRYFRRQGMDSNYGGALVIGEILILLQGLLGAYLFISGLRPGRGIHLLYGIVSALVIPGVFSYTQGDDRRRVMLIYGISLLILAALILRAITTAAVASPA
jgi:hypothetical protein